MSTRDDIDNDTTNGIANETLDDETRERDLREHLRALFPNGVPHEYSTVAIGADHRALRDHSHSYEDAPANVPERLGAVESSNRRTATEMLAASFIDAVDTLPAPELAVVAAVSAGRTSRSTPPAPSSLVDFRPLVQAPSEIDLLRNEIARGMAEAFTIPPELLGIQRNTNRATIDGARAELQVQNTDGSWRTVENVPPEARMIRERLSVDVDDIGAGGALIPPAMLDSWSDLFKQRGDRWWPKDRIEHFRIIAKPRVLELGKRPAPMTRCSWCGGDTLVHRLDLADGPFPIHMECDAQHELFRRRMPLGRRRVRAVEHDVPEHHGGRVAGSHRGEGALITEAARELLEWNPAVTVDDVRVYRRMQRAQRRAEHNARRAAFEARARQLASLDTLPFGRGQGAGIVARAQGMFLTRPRPYRDAAGRSITGRAHAEYVEHARRLANAERQRERARRAVQRYARRTWIDEPEAVRAMHVEGPAD